MTPNEALDMVRNNVPKAALHEALAEECSELTQAALKASRKERGDNPTPMSVSEVKMGLTEEVSDVLLCLEVLGLTADQDVMREKLERWVNRLVEAGAQVLETRGDDDDVPNA